MVPAHPKISANNTSGWLSNCSFQTGFRGQHTNFFSPTRPVFTCADGSIEGDNVCHLPTQWKCQGMAQKIHCSLPIRGFLLGRMEQFQALNYFRLYILTYSNMFNPLEKCIDRRQSSSGMNIYSRNLLKPPGCNLPIARLLGCCKHHGPPSRPTTSTNQWCSEAHMHWWQCCGKTRPVPSLAVGQGMLAQGE